MCLTSQTENKPMTPREMEQTYELASRKVINSYILMLVRGVKAGFRVYSSHQFGVYNPTIAHGDGTWFDRAVKLGRHILIS
jgi:uncharacterized protein YdiU (UPF0061 family)